MVVSVMEADIGNNGAFYYNRSVNNINVATFTTPT